VAQKNPGEDWTRVMRLARDVSPDALPPGAARHLLLAIATFVKKDGSSFVGVLALTRAMGYRLTRDGELTESARTSFWRTFAKLKKFVRHVPCDCPNRVHPFHFLIDVARLAGSQTATPPVAGQLRSFSRSATPVSSRTATSNTSIEQQGQHQSEHQYSTTPKNGVVDPRSQKAGSRESRKRWLAQMEEHRATQIAEIRKKAEAEGGEYDRDNESEVRKATDVKRGDDDA
jgi:hypothetical protein